MTSIGNLLDLGLREYVDVWNIQRKLHELRSKKLVPDTLILVEHPPVFTVGKGVQGELPEQIGGVPVIRIERGGQWTYHGPGQLVGYPILDLNARQRDVRGFVRNMEGTLIRALNTYGIMAERQEGQIGVWVRTKKIASIGAAIRNWISFHGFALNVNVDLNYFHMITPCGFPGSTMTSMDIVRGMKIDFLSVKNEVLRAFQEVFGIQLTPSKTETLKLTVT